ncbi:zinc metallochaperone AztD [Pelagibacterium sp. 26DY04]|uniref:zinc metallochaperone AztD n=1 Tax=Pelagibacterium sp. 26DY04 TaxID=2967130 RepID=UPI0028161666|nr:zinc metallochaperone AztD [Pelagibacterium sp. 26DY04]WMT87365.1 zinc metallochaperone AztD [Pelagibacterium sp. 26DY04]
MRSISLHAALLAGLALPGSVLADEVTLYRAFVADQAENTVSVVDLEAGEVIEAFTLEGPARLYGTSSGQTVFAVQGDNDIVQAISTGVVIDDHGDHGDIEISDPSLIDGSVEGDYPVHFVEHHGQIALFFDNEGVAKIIDESGFGTDEPRVVSSSAPHHGVAAAYGDHVLITEPHPEDPSNLPVGINVLDGDDNPIGETHACPGLHGEASSGNLLAIACETGLLLVTDSAEGPQVSHLPYADDLPEGKVSTLLGGVGIQYFLGNFGADRVVVIDPAEESFNLIDLPTRRVHFAVDNVRPQYAYIFTEDGDLHRLNTLSGQFEGKLTLTEPYSMDGHWADPRPRIAVAGDEILVTDPRESTIHRVDAQAFEPAGGIAVPGLPYEIVVAGGSGAVH